MTHTFNDTEIQAREREFIEDMRSPVARFHKLEPLARKLSVPDAVPLRRDRVIYRITTRDAGTLWLGQRRITQQYSPLYAVYTRHGDEVFRAPLLCLVKAYVRRTF